MKLRRSAIRSLALTLVAGLALLHPAAAAADEPAGTRYRELVRDAVAEYERGNWDEAFRNFAEAHAVSPNARTFRGMGVAAFEARRYASAVGHLRAALEDARKPLSAGQRAEVQAALDRAESFVARYRLSVSPEAARVTVDSRAPVLDGQGLLLLDPGPHELVFAAEGHEPVSRRVEARAGDRGELEVALASTANPRAPEPRPAQVEAAPVPAPSAAAPVSSDEDAHGDAGGHRLWAYVAGGTGLALAATGAVLLVQARGEYEDIEQACPVGRCERETIQRMIDDSGGETLQTLAIVAWGASAALLGAAVWLYLDEGEQGGGPQLGLAPSGVRLRGSF